MRREERERERMGQTDREQDQGTERRSKIISQDVVGRRGEEMVLVVEQVRGKAQGTTGPGKVVFL